MSGEIIKSAQITAVMLANTLAKKWRLAFLVRFDRSPDSTTCAPSTKALMSKGNAGTSRLSALGYGTGSGHEPQRDSIG
jgi:hypothetical protein